MRVGAYSAVTRLVFALGAFGCVCSGVVLAQSVVSGANLKGILKDESGTPLANANVIVISKVPPGAANGNNGNGNNGNGKGNNGTGAGSTDPVASTGSEVSGKTDSQGNFSLGGIPPGKYTICIQDHDNKHLDPCFWSAGTQVDMSDGKDKNNQPAQAISAATLQVRIDDPLKLSDPRAGQFETLVAVILPNGQLAPMNLVTSDQTGKTFQLAVPVGSYKVMVKSNRFIIADGTGTVINDKSAGNGHFFPPVVNAPVSIATGTSYVELSIVGKR